jgi:hypothetical protein
VGTICDASGFGQAQSQCCVMGWDPACADAAAISCDVCAVCGDGLALGMEACDGSDLAGSSCISEGYIAGTLACNPDCTLDTSGCVANGGGDCCNADGTPGCDDETCTTHVCFADASCCLDAWDDACAGIAATICTTCGGTPPEHPCAEEDLGSALGSPVATGNTALGDDDIAQSCDMGGGIEHVMSWTAPFAGTFVADTIGSAYDTSVTIYTACDAEYACDDDSGGGGAASLTGFVPAGQVLLIAVSGAPGDTGDWVLNINAM